MTTMTAWDGEARLATGWFDALFRREPLFAGAALVLAALIAPTLFAAALDERALGGFNVWIKPLKFELSLVIYLATLALFASELRRGATGKRAYRVFSIVVVIAIAAEMVWLLGAAGAGVASHFNRDSALMSTVYSVMGVAAVTLTSPTLVYGVLILRDKQVPPTTMRRAIGIGMVMTFFATLVTAGTMASGTSHLVGETGGAALPLMGWAREAGDLRVAHFFATHAMQALPLFALALTPLGLSRGRATAAVWGFAAIYLALVGWTFFEALAGRPFIA